MSKDRRKTLYRQACLLATVCLSLSGCSWTYEGYHWARLQMPQSAGLKKISTDLYVEPGMSEAQVAALMIAKEWARSAVQQAYGSVTSTPVIHAFHSELAYRRFGGGITMAKVYGERIIISPRGLNGPFIAHEWSHAELHKRLSIAGYLRVPSWFDEGVAVAISEAPETSELHWQWLLDHGIAHPDRTELMSLQSNAQWGGAIRRYGEDQNMQRAARGEPPQRPVYTAAGHELRPWLACAGSKGLLHMIEALNAHDDFLVVYQQVNGPARITMQHSRKQADKAC